MRIAMFLALGLLTLAFTAAGALAFHDAGVAECAGCHTMHNSQDGAPVDTLHVTGNPYLLKAANATDACLSCHAAYGQFADGTGFGAGGDFYWVTKTWQWNAHGHDYFSQGDSHGHNVVSPTYGIAVDATLSQAPGGTFNSNHLACTSCHDPHGNQNFRLLYGSALGPLAGGVRFNFTADAPLAVGNSRRTVSGSGIETDLAHTVYKQGMSEWCANCHTTIHSGNTTNIVHETEGNMGSTIAATYNAYVNTNDQSGVQAGAYMGLVPFEDVDVDLATVDPTNYDMGPTSSDEVMCVTCHRAHASPFSDIARWDMGETFLADSHPVTGDIGATADDIARKYYNYTFIQDQRSLCNKCHFKDQFDAPY